MRRKALVYSMVGLMLLLSAAVLGRTLGAFGSKGPDGLPDRSWLEPVYKVKAHKDLTYAAKRNAAGNQETLALDLYEPVQSGATNRPAVLFLHGGGFNSGDKREADRLMQELAGRGYVAVSANYRLRPNPEEDMPGALADAVDDVKDAMRWLRENRASYRIDTGRIALGGDSAGGLLSVAFANQWTDKAGEDGLGLFAVLDLYGPLFREPLRDGFPSTLIIHGTKDSTVPYHESEQLYDKLGAAGGYRQFVTLVGGGHNYQDPGYWEEVVTAAAHFLRNAMAAPSLPFLPDRMEISAFAGDTAKLQLIAQGRQGSNPRTGQFRFHLPEKWQWAGEAAFSSHQDASMELMIPEDAHAGLYPVTVEAVTGQGESPPVPLTLFVKVKEPLSFARTTYFHLEDRQIRSRLDVKNTSGHLLRGKLYLRGLESSDKSRREIHSIDSLKPGETRQLELPFLPDDVPLIVYENPEGVPLQETSLKSYVLAAEKRIRPPVLDGALDDWKGSSTFPLSRKSEDRLHERTGADDLGGTGLASWDEDFLYLALEVQDDRHVQQEASVNLYRGDSVQFSFRTTGESGTPSDVHEFGAALREDGSTAVFRWIAPPGFPTGEIKNVKAGIQRSGSKTRYEIAVPWGELGLVSAAEGTHLKFSLLVNDNDGQGRKGWVEYNSGIGFKDKEAFGDLFLLNGKP